MSDGTSRPGATAFFYTVVLASMVGFLFLAFVGQARSAGGQGLTPVRCGPGRTPSAGGYAVPCDSLAWEVLHVANGGGGDLWRIQTPGGWLVASGQGLAHVPDPGHRWLAEGPESGPR